MAAGTFRRAGRVPPLGGILRGAHPFLLKSSPARALNVCVIDAVRWSQSIAGGSLKPAASPVCKSLQRTFHFENRIERNPRGMHNSFPQNRKVPASPKKSPSGKSQSSDFKAICDQTESSHIKQAQRLKAATKMQRSLTLASQTSRLTMSE